MKKFVTIAALFMAMSLQGFSQNFVQQWGKLKLVGNQLSSESGQTVQLRGWSTHGKQWWGQCFDDKGDFENMKKKGANMARIAMYIGEGGGVDLNWIKQCVDWTNELGMYCLVDWHILTPGNPNDGMYNGAENFFKELSQWVSQNGKKNVLYEICNEPNVNNQGDPYEVGGEVWKQVKTYSNKILPVIAQNDPNAVVIVGTPQWDKALSYPMEDPIDTRGLNVMYSFHHYTCDQQFFLGIMSGAAASIPVFVTEWGASTDDGGANGQVCLDDADNLMKVCNGMNLGNQVISWANWSWSADYRSSSTFSSYPDGLTQSGNYIVSQLGKGDNFQYANSTPYDGAQVFDGKKDLLLALEKYDKGGQNVGYYDFDREDWWNCKACNTGDYGNDNPSFRANEYVDLGYTDKKDPDAPKSIGYIVNGEWVKYTIDVKEAGIYEFETYVNNHIDHNIVAISVDGKNALVGENGEEKYKAFKMQTSGSGDKDGGYGEWGWKEAKCEQDANYKFRIKFEKTGEQVLGIAFLTSNSGLGSLKIKGTGVPDGINEVESQSFTLYPNPTEGTFNVAFDGNGTLQVINLNGAVVYESAIDGDTNIDTNLASGVYIVKVISDENVMVQKLVVK